MSKTTVVKNHCRHDPFILFQDKIRKLSTYHSLFPINRRKVINCQKQSGFLEHPVECRTRKLASIRLRHCKGQRPTLASSSRTKLSVFFSLSHSFTITPFPAAKHPALSLKYRQEVRGQRSADALCNEPHQRNRPRSRKCKPTSAKSYRKLYVYFSGIFTCESDIH